MKNRRVTDRTPAARKAAETAYVLAQQELSLLEPFLAEEDRPRDLLFDILESYMGAAREADFELPR